MNYSIVQFIHIAAKRYAMLWSYSSDANNFGHMAIAVSLANEVYMKVLFLTYIQCTVDF